MKRLSISCLLCLFIFSSSYNQIFETDTLKFSGDIDNRINFVFLSDGYLENELDKFLVDVDAITEELFTQPPWLRYKNYFNLIAIKVPSNVSGASLDPENLIDNYFGSSYNSYGIERLLVPFHTNKIQSVLADNFPEYDQVFMIVNSDKYGGSGGWVATASTNVQSVEVAIHELGHSFAGLADEYWAGSQYAAEKVNMTRESNPDLVKWKHWMNINRVGIYAHDPPNQDWYRPHQNCKMRYLGRAFCYVCREAIAQQILSLVNPVESYSPTATSLVISEDQLFSLDILEPEPNTIKILWYLNGEIISRNTDSLLLNIESLSNGNYTLRATVIDTVRYISIASHFTEDLVYIDWNIDVSSTGIEIDSNTNNINLKVFPNPAGELLTLEFFSDQYQDIEIEIIDLLGRKHYLNKIDLSSGYKLTHSINIKSAGIKPGLYIFRIKIGIEIISRKILIE